MQYTDDQKAEALGSLRTALLRPKDRGGVEWGSVDEAMRAILRGSGVSAWDLLGFVSSRSLVAWFNADPWIAPVSHESVVYFIATEDDERIKIGYTKHLSQRFSVLQSSSVEPLKLVGFIAGDRQTERRLHLRFASERLHGEWFRRSPELVALIQAVQREWPGFS